MCATYNKTITNFGLFKNSVGVCNYGWEDVCGNDRLINDFVYMKTNEGVDIIKGIIDDILILECDRVSNDNFDTTNEKPLIGIIKYADKVLEKNGIKPGTLVGFKPSSEYEFVIDGERFYRVQTDFITIKYEYQGDEKEYNPSWSQSG